MDERLTRAERDWKTGRVTDEELYGLRRRSGMKPHLAAAGLAVSYVPRVYEDGDTPTPDQYVAFCNQVVWPKAIQILELVSRQADNLRLTRHDPVEYYRTGNGRKVPGVRLRPARLRMKPRWTEDLEHRQNAGHILTRGCVVPIDLEFDASTLTEENDTRDVRWIRMLMRVNARIQAQPIEEVRFWDVGHHQELLPLGLVGLEEALSMSKLLDGIPVTWPQYLDAPPDRTDEPDEEDCPHILATPGEPCPECGLEVSEIDDYYDSTYADDLATEPDELMD